MLRVAYHEGIIDLLLRLSGIWLDRCRTQIDTVPRSSPGEDLESVMEASFASIFLYPEMEKVTNEFGPVGD